MASNEPIQLGTSQVEAFNSSVMALVQQQESRLRNTVRNESMQARAGFFEQIAPTEVVEITSRHEPTNIVDTIMDRRQVTATPYAWADIIDDPDRARILISPDGPFALNAGMAHGRRIDRTIIAALNGTATAGGGGGESPTRQVPFGDGVIDPGGNVVPVDFQSGGGGSASNLTLDKIRETSRILNAAEVNDGDRTWVTTASGLFSLLHDTEVISSDFNTVKALVNGEINAYMGFTFVRVEFLPGRGLAGGTGGLDLISNLVYHRMGGLWAPLKDITTVVNQRPDVNNYTQVHVSADHGATRMEEERVVRVLADEGGAISGA